jgi:hypothetical protein
MKTADLCEGDANDVGKVEPCEKKVYHAHAGKAARLAAALDRRCRIDYHCF